MHEATTLTPKTVPADSGAGYYLVRNLILFQVHTFRRKYGGAVDELIAEANLAFVKKHNQYVTGKSPTGKKFTFNYATEISNTVWCHLFDRFVRREARRGHLAKMVPIFSCVNGCHDSGLENCMQFEDSRYKFSSENENLIGRNDFNFTLFQLSKNARFVVALALDPPNAVMEKAEIKGGENRNYRSAIREYLLLLKWSSKKVDQAFNEILSILGQ